MVLRLNLPSDTLTRWMLPEVVAALALAGPGQVVLALRRSVGLLDLGSARLHTVAEVLEVPDGQPAQRRQGLAGRPLVGLRVHG